MLFMGVSFIFTMSNLFRLYRALSMSDGSKFLLICISRTIWIIVFSAMNLIIASGGTKLVEEANLTSTLITKILPKCHNTRIKFSVSQFSRIKLFGILNCENLFVFSLMRKVDEILATNCAFEAISLLWAVLFQLVVYIWSLVLHRWDVRVRSIIQFSIYLGIRWSPLESHISRCWYSSIKYCVLWKRISVIMSSQL